MLQDKTKDKKTRSNGSRRAEPAEMGAKAQIKEYKESLILDAAAALFYEKGFQRTTIDEIGVALGVTKPFIYTYFDSKHRILERLFDRAYHEVFEGSTSHQELNGADVVVKFKHFVSWYIRKNLELRLFSAILLEEEKNLSPEKLAEMRAMQRRFDDLFRDLVIEGVSDGVFHVEEPKLACLAIDGMVRWTHRWYSPDGRLTSDEVVRNLVDMALRVVGWSGAHPEVAAPRATTRRKAVAG